MFTGRTDTEAETPILWPPDVKSWLIWKDPDVGKDWRQEEKGTTWDEIDGWMASPTQWTWVWVNSGNWWWTGRLGVLRFMGLQIVRHDWETELNWQGIMFVVESYFVGTNLVFPQWILFSHHLIVIILIFMLSDLYVLLQIWNLSLLLSLYTPQSRLANMEVNASLSNSRNTVRRTGPSAPSPHLHCL